MRNKDCLLYVCPSLSLVRLHVLGWRGGRLPSRWGVTVAPLEIPLWVLPHHDRDWGLLEPSVLWPLCRRIYRWWVHVHRRCVRDWYIVNNLKSNIEGLLNIYLCIYAGEASLGEGSGLVCLYSLKNPNTPERSFPSPCGVTSVHLHPAVSWLYRTSIIAIQCHYMLLFTMCSSLLCENSYWKCPSIYNSLGTWWWQGGVTGRLWCMTSVAETLPSLSIPTQRQGNIFYLSHGSVASYSFAYTY